MEFKNYIALVHAKLRLEELTYLDFKMTDDELDDMIEDLYEEGLSVDEAFTDILFENLD